MAAVLDAKTNAKNSTSQASKLRDVLEEEIVNGVVKPGDRLDEAALAERFNVSRTPIREAFKYLVGSGLVETVPNRGTFVASVGLPQLVEMFEVMAELEGMCARLAARRITEEESAELQSLLDDCAQAKEQGDLDGYYYINQQFHDCIYRASHNQFLAQQTRQLQTRLKPYRRLQLRVRNRASTSLEEHRLIVAAIVNGDEQAAESHIKDHVRIQGERFTDFVATIDHS
ncbi:GntR family transcriptional regulator [Thiosocius teredinicola]|uniref:GntR family transcriptional regulator n=1 Tax=Thiosocius teredinicola TaxID=1973002 RepID=UPI002FE48268